MKKYLLYILLLVSILLVGCSKLKEKRGYVYAMSTSIDIALYGENSDILEEACNKIEDVYKSIDKLANPYFEYNGINNIYKINNNKKTINEEVIYEDIIIENELFYLLFYAFSLKNETNGHFNPFMGRLNNIYKNIINKNYDKDSEIDIDSLINEKVIKAELNLINNTTLEFNKDNLTVKKIGDGLIDLGGIAKGYATLKAKEILDEYNITHYVINAGVSSIALGKKPNGANYKIGVKNIPNFYIEINSKALATSSISEQITVNNGKAYHHVIDPFTGMPTTLYDTVVVIGDNSCVLDVLSTAFMSMQEDDIFSMAKDFGVEVLTFKDGKLLFSTSEEHIYV